MTSFIGLPGALAPVACPTSENVQQDRAVSEVVPFSGRRVVQLGRGVRRSWSVGHGAKHPRDYAVLDALTRWETPLVWVGAMAQATNLLTPGQATLGDATFSGGASARRGLINPGGIPAVSWAGGLPGSVVSLTGPRLVPVRPGVPVTVAVWTQRADSGRSTRLVYEFRDATGANVDSGLLTGPSGPALQRAVWTIVPPVSAAEVVLGVHDAATVALPQVTWTPGEVEYAPGRGVHRVVVVPGSESPIVAHSRQVLTSAAYTILEVG